MSPPQVRSNCDIKHKDKTGAFHPTSQRWLTCDLLRLDFFIISTHARLDEIATGDGLAKCDEP